MSVDVFDRQVDQCLVEIGLIRDELSGEWFAERLVYFLSEIKNRLAFSQPVPLRRAFTDDFCDGIQAYLPASTERTVRIDSHGVISLPELVLGSIRIMTHGVVMGLQRVTLRFKRAVGALHALLRPEHRTETTLGKTLDRAAADTLLSLVQPCLDLAHLDPGQVAGAKAEALLSKRLENLAQTHDELSFFAHLLRRYIEQRDAVKVPAAGSPAPLQECPPIEAEASKAEPADSGAI